MSKTQSTKIRAGLYEVTSNGNTYMVEDFQDWDTQRWSWRVTGEREFYGDFDTKADALRMIGGMA